MKNEELTLKKLELLYKRAQEMPESKSILVPRTLAKEMDDEWDKFSLLYKLIVNIKRLFNGNGLYKKLT